MYVPVLGAGVETGECSEGKKKEQRKGREVSSFDQFPSEMPSTLT